MGSLIDKQPCEKRVWYAGYLNTGLHALAVNNWAVIAGAASTVAIPVGIVGGALYYTFRTSIEPGVYSCGYEKRGSNL